jgi:hypothetical protein
MDYPGYKNPYEFNAFMVIDTVSNVVKLVKIDKKISVYVAQKYAQA